MMDSDLYMRSVLVLALVLGMILLAGVVLRRFGPARHLAGQRGRARRLRVLESAPLDGRRRLVLVRCDDRDHLLLIGGETDLLIEAGRPAPDEPSPTRSGPINDGADARPSFGALLSRQTGGRS